MAKAVVPPGLRPDPVRTLPHAFGAGLALPPAPMRPGSAPDWKLPDIAARCRRITTGKDAAAGNRAEWLTPGHPLFEALRRRPARGATSRTAPAAGNAGLAAPSTNGTRPRGWRWACSSSSYWFERHVSEPWLERVRRRYTAIVAELRAAGLDTDAGTSRQKRTLPLLSWFFRLVIALALVAGVAFMLALIWSVDRALLAAGGIEPSGAPLAAVVLVGIPGVLSFASRYRS